MENIVTKHKTYGIVADKLLADYEGLRKAVGRRPLRVGEAHAEIRSRRQKPLESGQIGRGGDNEYVTDTGQHQDRNRIVHHRFVVDGKQLLAHTPS